MTRPAESANTRSGHQDRPLLNIIFNIVVPVALLHQSHRFGPHGATIGLLLAMAFPLFYGLHDLLRQHRINFFSLIGIINVGITGTLALASLHGKWFVLKDSSMPAILGIAVAASAFSKKPFIRTLLFNEKVLNVKLIQDRLAEKQAEHEFRLHLRNTTLLLSGTFFVSAVANFFLSRHVFTNIATNIPQAQQSLILNQQIAHMTWLSTVVTTVPSLLMMVGILIYLISGIRKHTGLNMEEFLHST